MSESGGIFDQIMDILTERLGADAPAELLSGEISVDEITDVLAESGFDLSQLSDAEIATLVSFEDSTTIEFPSGVRVERKETDQFGFGAAGALGAGGIGALGHKMWHRDEQDRRAKQ
jgi:hypothetical protein